MCKFKSHLLIALLTFGIGIAITSAFISPAQVPKVVFSLLLACNSSRQSLPPIEVTPSQLVHDYHENPVNADKKYKGRTLNITGDIAKVVLIGEKIETTFEDYNSTGRFSIVCYSDRSPQEDLLFSLEGQRINFVGISDGRVGYSTISIIDCKINNF